MADFFESPFEVLGVSPSAEPVVILAAYRALARTYHPDLNPGITTSELNQRMVKINWAKEQLEKDLEGWRKRATINSSAKATNQTPSPQDTKAVPTQPNATWSVPSSPPSVIQVEPPILFLAGRRGSSATFSAKAGAVPPAEIRARFKTGLIEVARLQSKDFSVRFQVTVSEDFTTDITDNAVERVEVYAPGTYSETVFVSVTPVNQTTLSPIYPPRRVAPARFSSKDARISFGKHRGRTFEEIAVEEPGYLRWMLREGAGSRIERQSAQLALDSVKGGIKLREPAPRVIHEIPEPVAATPRPKLADPSKPKGLWGAIKALIAPQDRN